MSRRPRGMGARAARTGGSMSRSWKIVLGIVVAIIAVNVGTRILNSLTGGSPGGPTSSSYATGADGVAGYLSLLAGDGHPVERIRTYPAHTTLAADATAVVLDPGFVDPADAQALRVLRRAAAAVSSSAAEASRRCGCARCCSRRRSGRRPASRTRIGSIPVAGLAGARRLSGAQATAPGATRARALPVYGTSGREPRRRRLARAGPGDPARRHLASPGRLSRHRRQRTLRARRGRGLRRGRSPSSRATTATALRPAYGSIPRALARAARRSRFWPRSR